MSKAIHRPKGKTIEVEEIEDGVEQLANGPHSADPAELDSMVRCIRSIAAEVAINAYGLHRYTIDTVIDAVYGGQTDGNDSSADCEVVNVPPPQFRVRPSESRAQPSVWAGWA